MTNTRNKPATDDDSPKVYVGRQPIFTANSELYAYELLFRQGTQNAASFEDGTVATKQVLNNLMLEFGFDQIIGNVPGFVNFTRELFLSNFAELLPKDRVVLEVLEDVEIDDELVECIKSHAAKGYRIALDDFIYESKWDALAEVACIIKIDVMAQPMDETIAYVESLKRFNVELLAEKVETREEYELLKDAGYKYFQGYYFLKPEILSKKVVPQQNISLLRLLARLQDPDVEVDELEELISQDVSISVRLLRFLNSASNGLQAEVKSMRQAVVFFGLERLKNWISLIALTDNQNDKPLELIRTGLTRGKFCELVAISQDLPEPKSFFVVGLFSILDCMLDTPMEKILESLPLDENIKTALLTHEDVLGEALTCAEECEKGNWQEVKFLESDSDSISKCFFEAMIWTDESLAEIKG